MSESQIICSDAIEWAKNYTGKLFHAMICDPPYHLTTITKRFGKDGSAPAKFGTDGVYQRSSAGFMNCLWDGGDIAFQSETWKAFYNILLPGAFGMAFGGSRTAHRMAVAIEDAGFIIHPQMSWVYATGFPKATRIDKQIDNEAGAERKKEWYDRHHDGVTRETKNYIGTIFKGLGGGNIRERAATDLAKQWKGHRYGLQALKPASEPIIVFQKPYEGRPVDCITETGAGALNIDGGRIGLEDTRNHKKGGGGKTFHGQIEIERISGNASGRWPANFVLTHSHNCQMIGYRDSDSYQINRFTDGAKPFGDGAGHEFESEEVEGGRVPVWECVDGCPVRALDRQSGHLTSGTGAVKKATSAGHQGNVYGSDSREFGTPNIEYGDSGGASRFFHQSHWAIENADPFVYQAKVSVSERNAGLNSFGKQEIAYSQYRENFEDTKSFVSEYPDGTKRPMNKQRNPHPTLKPIALIEHLATLLLPPKEYAPRRIFVPFCGVASEVIGCWRAGWEEITGIELEAEYAEIGKARLEYWKKQGVQLDLFEEK